MAHAERIVPLPSRTASGSSFELTGPGTPARAYLRRFWQPVYHCADLKPAQPVPLRIMSESYTLYRGTSGETRLVESRCPHRGTLLSTGRVEGDALRCFYHGWKFGGDGRCIEQPVEDPSFAAKISIRSWPVREYLGLVFAYLGEGAPPEFPTYPTFEHFKGLVEVDSYLRYCNYFQNVENSLDMSHVGFVHADNRASFEGIGLGGSLKAEESEWGVTYSFHRTDGRERVQQFGMPNVFYMTALPTETDVDWQESLFWWVPIDDESHMQFSLHRVPIEGEAATRFKARRKQRRSGIDQAHQDLCDSILAGRTRLQDVDRTRVDLVRLQDDIAQVGQGTFASSNPERLGRADIGVIAIRKLYRRELESMLAGRTLKNWQRPAGLVPRAWDLGDARGQAALATTSDDATAEIIDIRPHVEVELHLQALHGGPRRAG